MAFYNSDALKINNARISYPSLWQHGNYQGKSTGKYQAKILVPKSDKGTINKIEGIIKEGLKEAKISRPQGDMCCITDGDESGKPDYEGYYVISTNSKKRPQVIDRNRQALLEEDEVIFPGCTINAIISLYMGKNKYGKNQIGANILGVQFVGGDPVEDAFGQGSVDVSDQFDDLDEEL